MDRNHYNKNYIDFTKKHAGRSSLFTDCLKAFFTGGIICALGQCLYCLCLYLSCTEEQARLIVSVTLILIAAVLTGMGLFDKIAKFAGAGTLVPITGFANSIVSPAIDTKKEGIISGLGSKIFTVSGPVILYGVLASVIYGIIYFLWKVF